jgi:uncharacterized protein YaeQ
MAIKSTIFKAELQVADMDRSRYGTHALTLARHPSENDERMMVRLLAFALHAGGDNEEPLSFANAMEQMDEPDLWRKSLVGEIELWVDVGQPEEKWLRKASHRSVEVVLYLYGRSGPLWWSQNGTALQKFANLRVRLVPADASTAMTALAQRTMKLQCTVQDGTVWLGDGQETVEMELVELKAARPQ